MAINLQKSNGAIRYYQIDPQGYTSTISKQDARDLIFAGSETSVRGSDAYITDFLGSDVLSFLNPPTITPAANTGDFWTLQPQFSTEQGFVGPMPNDIKKPLPAENQYSIMPIATIPTAVDLINQTKGSFEDFLLGKNQPIPNTFPDIVTTTPAPVVEDKGFFGGMYDDFKNSLLDFTNTLKGFNPFVDNPALSLIQGAGDIKKALSDKITGASGDVVDVISGGDGDGVKTPTNIFNPSDIIQNATGAAVIIIGGLIALSLIKRK